MPHRPLSTGVLSLFLLVLAGCAPNEPLPGSILPQHARWALTFRDEFDGDEIDWDTWQSQTGPRGGTHKEGRWPENNVVEGGLLRQVTRREDPPRGGKGWSTAHVWTRTFQQQYGYFEARMRYGKHLNNAFWLYRPEGERFTKPPFFEIDINEGHTPREVAMTVHYWVRPEGASVWDLFSTNKMWDAPVDLDEDFHVYGCEWNAQEIIWYFDGKPVRRLNNWGAHAPADVRLSTVFAGGHLDEHGNVRPEMDGVSMDVDWVRVYRKVGDRPDAGPPVSSTIALTRYEPPSVKKTSPQVSLTGRTVPVLSQDFERTEPGRLPPGWIAGFRTPQVVAAPGEFPRDGIDAGKRVLRLEGGDYVLRMFDPGVTGRMEVIFDTATTARNQGLLLVTLGQFDVTRAKALPLSYYQGDIGPYIHWNRNFMVYYRDPEKWVPFARRTDEGKWQRVRFVIDVDKHVFDCYGGADLRTHLGGGRFRHDQKRALGIGLKHRSPGGRPVYIDNLTVIRYE